jgi:PAS domain-containing protein
MIGSAAGSESNPAWTEVFRLLDYLDWPGSPEHPIELDPAQRRLLERVVFETLDAAAGEAISAAHLGLVMRAPPSEFGSRHLRALERLSGLAARLMDPEVDDELGAAPARSPAAVAEGFESLADGLDLPVWVADPEFRVISINSACGALLGAGQASVEGTTAHDWWTPVDRARAVSRARAATMEHRAFSMRGSVRPRGGEGVGVLGVAVPRLCPAGELLGWAGVFFEESDSRPPQGWVARLEQSHTVTSATTQLLLSQLPGMIWTTDRDLRCTSSMGAGLHELGLEPNQIVGLTLCEFVGTTDPAHPARVAHVRALGGTASSYRDSRAGRDYEVRVEPLVAANGSVAGCLGISRDVTDAVARERAQSALIRQLDFAQSVARIGSWECDLASGEWLWSDEGYRLLGYEPGEVEPSFDTFISRVHPDDRAMIARRHERAVQAGADYEARYRVVLPNGSCRRMVGLVRFEWDSDGVLVRIAGLIRDAGSAD